MSDGGTSSWGGGDVLSCPLSCLLSKYSNSSICFKDTVSAKSFCCVPLFKKFFFPFEFTGVVFFLGGGGIICEQYYIPVMSDGGSTSSSCHFFFSFRFKQFIQDKIKIQ